MKTSRASVKTQVTKVEFEHKNEVIFFEPRVHKPTVFYENVRCSLANLRLFLSAYKGNVREIVLDGSEHGKMIFPDYPETVRLVRFRGVSNYTDLSKFIPPHVKEVIIENWMNTKKVPEHVTHLTIEYGANVENLSLLPSKLESLKVCLNGFSFKNIPATLKTLHVCLYDGPNIDTVDLECTGIEDFEFTTRNNVPQKLILPINLRILNIDGRVLVACRHFPSTLEKLTINNLESDLRPLPESLRELGITGRICGKVVLNDGLEKYTAFSSWPVTIGRIPESLHILSIISPNITLDKKTVNNVLALHLMMFETLDIDWNAFPSIEELNFSPVPEYKGSIEIPTGIPKVISMLPGLKRG